MQLSWMIGKKVSGISLSTNLDKSPASVTILFEDGSEVTVHEVYAEGEGGSGISILDNPKKATA